MIISKNARRYPSPDGEFVLLVVLNEDQYGEIIKHRAYGAIVRDDSLTNPNCFNEATPWVGLHGNKLSYTEAVSHFPVGLSRETYED